MDHFTFLVGSLAQIRNDVEERGRLSLADFDPVHPTGKTYMTTSIPPETDPMPWHLIETASRYNGGAEGGFGNSRIESNLYGKNWSKSAAPAKPRKCGVYENDKTKESRSKWRYSQSTPNRL